MEDTRITFETAKLAKEKGFPQEPNRLKIPYYNYKGEFKGDVTDFLRKYLKKEDTSNVESVSAPTQSILAKWLREEHNIDVLVTSINGSKLKRYVSKIYVNKLYVKLVGHSDNYENTFEKGLQETLKLINYD